MDRSADILVRTRCDQYATDQVSMPVGCSTHRPGGMAENSPTFQRWDLDNHRVKVPKGRLTVIEVSRPCGTYCSWTRVPNVETLGYYRKSLRDTELPVFS